MYLIPLFSIIFDRNCFIELCDKIQTASKVISDKTIIFAEIVLGIYQVFFNNRYPEKKRERLCSDDYSIKHYQTLIDDFKIREISSNCVHNRYIWIGV